jgi:DNA-binding LacI/PurR family transcriptional regulator
MVAHGRTTEDRLVVEGDWTVASGEAAFNQIIDARPDIDAIYASNDQMALGVLHGALCRGMRVPEDLAVIGTDNTAEGSHYWPPLSTVDQPLGLAGEMAVKAVDGLIAHSRTIRRAADVVPEMTLLEPELIVRQSTRPVVASPALDQVPASADGEPMPSRASTL